EILRQVLREPALDADEFERMKVQRLARLEQGRADPPRLAPHPPPPPPAEYPPHHGPHVPTAGAGDARTKAAHVRKVRALYRDFVGASDGELTVVGDFEPSEALPVLARALSGWKAPKPYARIERPYQPGLGPDRETIVTPDKANATYLAGLTMPVGD